MAELNLTLMQNQLSGKKMIKDLAKAEIADILGVNNVTLDVNFDENYKDCLKLTIAGQEAIVKYTDLFSFMFVLASKEQQAKMIPIQQEKGDEYMRQHHVRLKRDMKEGEELIVNCKIHVPTIIEESIKKEELPVIK